MEQNPSSEANRFAASQEIPRIFWNPKADYCIHKCPPPVSVLIQLIQSIPPHPTSWKSILILYSHLRLGLSSGLFHRGFPTETLYTPLPSPIRATCHTHLILLDFITRTILGEHYRSLRYSFYSFFYSALSSYITQSSKANSFGLFTSHLQTCVQEHVL
jgi:hypothetical protein